MPHAAAQQYLSRVVRAIKSKTVIIAAALILLYTLAGFFLAPYLVKHQLTKFVQDDLHRQLTIDQVRFNPYTLRMEVEGLSLMEGNGDSLLGFHRLVVDFEVSRLWEWAWTFAEIGLEEPKLTLVINAQRKTNLKRLMDDLPTEAESPPAPADAEEPPPRLLFHRIHIGGGTVRLVDHSQPGPAEATVSQLDLQANELSTLPQREGSHRLAARLPGGGRLEWRGDGSLFPVHSHGQILVTKLKPSNAWRFFQTKLRTEEPGGMLDVETGYRFALEQGDVQLTLDRLKANLSETSLTPRSGHKPILALKTATVDGGSFDLGERRLNFKRTTLANGKLAVQINPKGVLNWQALIPPSKPASSSKSAGAQSKKSNNTPGRPWHIEVGKFAVTDLTLTGADLSRKVPVDLAVGDFDLSTHLLTELTPKGVQTVADGLAVGLGNIALAQHADRKTMASIGEIKLVGGMFNLAERNVALKEISLRDGYFALLRNRDGQIDWVQQLLDRGVVRTETKTARERAQAEGRPWSVELATVQLSNTAASFADLSLSKPDVFTLKDIALSLNDISLDPQQPIGFDLAFQVQQGGAVRAKGTAQPFQPRVNGTVEVKQLALATAQPFVEQVAKMKLESGELSGGGELHYGSEQPDSLQFIGDFDIDGLKIVEPQTNETLVGWNALSTKGMRLDLKPNTLILEKIALTHPEGTFIINEDNTTNWHKVFGGQTKTPSRGTSPAAPKNTRKAAVEPAPSPESSNAFPVSIAHIRLDDGALNFADLSLRPQFGTHIHKLKGTIAGFSTTPGAQARVELNGRVDKYGEAKINGELQPSNPTAEADIHMAFRNIEMTHLTPYSIKFAAHKVNSGKLSLNLGYQFQHQQLKGANQIVITHLELGKKVASRDALNLPLELGIALLKDSKGKIDINLPVHGDMSDPKFSFGHLIGQAIVNFFAKLVTAPFRILGSLLGTGAEDLDQIAFEPGRDDLAGPEQEKLDRVAKALRERPELAISIQARFDPQGDSQALKEQKIRRAVAITRGTRPKSGEDPEPVSFNDIKSQAALEELFSRRVSPAALAKLKQQFAKGEKPPTARHRKPTAQPFAVPDGNDTRGLYKAIYNELIKDAEVSQMELTILGHKRARAIQHRLTGSGGIAAERVSVSKPVKAKSSSVKDAGVITRLELAAAR